MYAMEINFNFGCVNIRKIQIVDLEINACENVCLGSTHTDTLVCSDTVVLLWKPTDPSQDVSIEKFDR